VGSLNNGEKEKKRILAGNSQKGHKKVAGLANRGVNASKRGWEISRQAKLSRRKHTFRTSMKKNE